MDNCLDLDKGYWTQYSSICDGVGGELFVNTSNGAWAYFMEGKYRCEGGEGTYPTTLIASLYDEFNEECEWC